MGLIDVLNQNHDKTPDEIVLALSDPIAMKLVHFPDMTLEYLESLEGRRIHFILRNEEGVFINDSGSSGEVFQSSDTYSAWTQDNYINWYMISAELYPRLDLMTGEIRNE